jgi:hypothetical protein
MRKKKTKMTKTLKLYKSIILNNRNPGIITSKPVFEESLVIVQETSIREPKVKNEIVYN